MYSDAWVCMQGSSPRTWAANLNQADIDHAAACCGDLRFVSTTASLISTLRRPFGSGNCILQSAASTAKLAVLAAAVYMRSQLVLAPADSASRSVRSVLLDAVCSILQQEQPACIVLLAQQLAAQPSTSLMLQAIVLGEHASALLTPAGLLEHCKGDMQKLLELSQALAPGVSVATVWFLLILADCLVYQAFAPW